MISLDTIEVGPYSLESSLFSDIVNFIYYCRALYYARNEYMLVQNPCLNVFNCDRQSSLLYKPWWSLREYGFNLHPITVPVAYSMMHYPLQPFHPTFDASSLVLRNLWLSKINKCWRARRVQVRLYQWKDLPNKEVRLSIT
jgi:hypothetical protein